MVCALPARSYQTGDNDYIAKTGTLTFAPGETTTITIEVKGDSKKEANETFYLDLFGPSSNALRPAKRSPLAAGRGILGGMSDVTHILAAIEAGDPRAAADLLPLVYDELRQLAAARLANEKPGQTLQATALVHEAYLRLVDVEKAQHWNSRGHFFAAAAEAMRRILIDNARRKKSEKHGGDRQRISLADVEVAAFDDADRWLLLDDALSKFAQEDSSAAQVAKLRLFAFLSVEESAEVLGIARATAFRHWTYARAWLQAELTGDQNAE